MKYIKRFYGGKMRKYLFGIIGLLLLSILLPLNNSTATELPFWAVWDTLAVIDTVNIDTVFIFNGEIWGTSSIQLSGSADRLDGVELVSISWADVAMATGDVNMDDISPANSDLNMSNNAINNQFIWNSQDLYNKSGSMNDNILSFAIDKGCTVTASESPDVGTLSDIFDGNFENRAAWDSTSTTFPLIIKIYDMSWQDYSTYWWIHFAWKRKPTSGYKIEYFETNGNTWHTVKDVSTDPSATDWACKYDTAIDTIKITIKSKDTDNAQIRIGEFGVSVAYELLNRYGYRLYKGGDDMFGQLDMNDNSITNIDTAKGNFGEFDSTLTARKVEGKILDLSEGFHLGADSIVVDGDTFSTPQIGWTFIDTTGGDTMKVYLNSQWEIK